MKDCTKCEKFLNCNLVNSSKHIHILGPDDKIPVEMAEPNNNLIESVAVAFGQDDILNNTYFETLIDKVAVSDNEKNNNK